MAQKKKKAPSERILETAFLCLSSRGYANVSMRDIANEANVALSQLTYYFKNKEGLFIEVINRMICQYIQEVKGSIQARHSTKEKIQSLVEYFQELIKSKPHHMRMFIDLTAQALWLPSFKEPINKLFSDLTRIIEQDILKGEALFDPDSDYSAHSVARLILGAIYGISIQIMLDEPDSTAKQDSLSVVHGLLG